MRRDVKLTDLVGVNNEQLGVVCSFRTDKLKVEDRRVIHLLSLFVLPGESLIWKG